MKKTFNDIPVRIVRSNRKTLAVQLSDEGIVVRAPKGLSEAYIMSFLTEKRDWIDKNWKKRQKELDDSRSLPPLTDEDIHFLADKACEVIPAKVEYYAKIIGVDYGRITIRNQKTRWGSCSEDGNLNFNCLLMLMPDEVIDSIVVHELCHRIYMNHSAEFNALVRKIYPDYDRCQAWIKENGRAILRRMTG